MPKTTKKAERAAQAKARRRIRVRMKAHQTAKRAVKLKRGTHPHRRTGALRQL
jgi:hypothetical protein